LEEALPKQHSVQRLLGRSRYGHSFRYLVDDTLCGGAVRLHDFPEHFSMERGLYFNRLLGLILLDVFLGTLY